MPQCFKPPKTMEGATMKCHPTTLVVAATSAGLETALSAKDCELGLEPSLRKDFECHFPVGLLAKRQSLCNFFPLELRFQWKNCCQKERPSTAFCISDSVARRLGAICQFHQSTKKSRISPKLLTTISIKVQWHQVDLRLTLV